MRHGTHGRVPGGPGLGFGVVCAVALLVTGCAALDRAGETGMAGCTISGARVVGSPRSAPGLTVGHGWPADTAREVRDRIRLGDCRFKAWMAGRGSDRAYLPGVSRAQGERLGRTGTIDVEVVDDTDVLPVERDPYSSRARRVAEYGAMARFNGCLFRELDRLGRIAP